MLFAHLRLRLALLFPIHQPMLPPVLIEFVLNLLRPQRISVCGVQDNDPSWHLGRDALEVKPDIGALGTGGYSVGFSSPA